MPDTVIIAEVTKHPGGRPLKFQSVEVLQAKIDAYFVECDREEYTRVYPVDHPLAAEFEEQTTRLLHE